METRELPIATIPIVTIEYKKETYNFMNGTITFNVVEITKNGKSEKLVLPVSEMYVGETYDMIAEIIETL